MRRTLAVVLIVSLGCGKSLPPPPATLSEAKAVAAASRDAAKSAREGKDAKAAANALTRAQQGADFARAFLAKPPITPADNALCNDTFAAAKEAKRWADLAGEDKRLAGELSTWKAKSYRAARGAAFKVVLTPMAMAARSAKSPDNGTLATATTSAADAAASLADFLGCARCADGTPAWDNVATTMSAAASNPPDNLTLLLGLGLLVLRQNGLALYEIETVNPQRLSARGNSRVVHALVRSAALSMNGFPNLAVEQLETQCAGAEGLAPGEGRQALGAFHLYLAFTYLQKKEFRQADLEFVRGMQAWPDNPLMIALTGERMAADGRWEQAAEALDAAAPKAKYPWLAARLGERAKSLRDKKGEAEPLFTDPVFLGEVLVVLAADSAGEAVSRRLDRAIAATRSLGQKLVDAVPKLP